MSVLYFKILIFLILLFIQRPTLLMKNLVLLQNATPISHIFRNKSIQGVHHEVTSRHALLLAEMMIIQSLF
uniref:Putative secreted protein n=1 Tax=Panstrongylus lignarius TaxID=156445 RepID=A0A224XUD8_9HEMI